MLSAGSGSDKAAINFKRDANSGTIHQVAQVAASGRAYVSRGMTVEVGTR